MMRNIIILVLCVIYTNGEFRFDYIYDQRAHGWFKLHSMPASWLAARAQCYYEGAVLASPLNKDLWKVIVNIIQKGKTYPEFVFSGVHSNYVEGIYTTVDGKPIEKLDITWAPNEPQYMEGQACLVYGRNGTMSNKKCTDHYPYICFKEWTTTTFPSRCGTIDHEYEFREETGSCYKFHRVGQSWFKAFAVCQAEGGHLVVIDHVNEVTTLKDIFSKYNQDSIKSQYKDTVSIGFTNHSGWWTIHGVPLQDAKYMIWSPSQPDNAKLSKCGGMFRTGLIDDVWCTAKFAFICEMPVGSLNYVEPAVRARTVDSTNLPNR